MVPERGGGGSLPYPHPHGYDKWGKCFIGTFGNIVY